MRSFWRGIPSCFLATKVTAKKLKPTLGEVGIRTKYKIGPELTATPAAAFPGNGQMRADLAEIAALKKEVARLRAARDILKKAAVDSTVQRNIFGLRCSERTHHDGTNRSRWLVA